MSEPGKEWPRLALTAAIIAYFGYALLFHWTNGIEETLKNITMLAVGFWLGSSKAGTDSGARTDKALDIAKTAQEQSPSPPPQPDVILEPGETAQAGGRT
ncbi:MAG TPA: hypothetical protein VF638_00950 [Sphingomonas sp.]|jgi:hypothetical protein